MRIITFVDGLISLGSIMWDLLDFSFFYAVNWMIEAELLTGDSWKILGFLRFGRFGLFRYSWLIGCFNVVCGM